MKLMTTVLSIASMIVACQAPQQAGKSNLSDLIKGEWTAEAPETPGRSRRPFWIFGDSTSVSSESWSSRYTYNIQQDSLIVKDTAGQVQHTYAINKLSADSLMLDTLTFVKVKPKNQIQPQAIWFASGMCFGRCPSLALHIDAQRNIKFFGRYSTSLTGGFSGTISDAEYKELVDLIHALPIDSLRESYAAPWTDDQPSGVIIQHGGTLTRASAYGSYKEPIELRMLLNRLMSVYRYANLKPDNKITETYFNAEPGAWKLLENAHPGAE